MPNRLDRRKSVRVGAPVAAVGAVAVAIGVIIATSSPGSSQGANKSSNQAGSGSAVVQRRDLVATDTESGTLSYAQPQTVYNRLSGTITSLPSIGQVVKAGQILYEVDNSPVVLFGGTTPAYRDLSPAVSNGPDVEQLNRNLIKLGFADGEIADNNTWQSGTTGAVERWQASLGETQTGTITLGQVVFLPGPQRITAVNAVIGSTGGSGSGSGSSASALVTPRPEFASLTTTTTTPRTSAPCPAQTGSSPGGSSQAGSTATTQTTPTTTCTPAKKRKPTGNTSSTQAQLKALEALLKAETAELQKENRSAGGTGGGAGGAGAGGARGSGAASGSGSGRSGGGAGGSGGSGGGSGGSGGGGSGASGGGGSGASGGGGSGGSGAGSGSGAGAGAQAILQTSSTQLVVTVNLDATKQGEAVVGEPVTVELPNGTTVDGKITAVSPVAQSSSSGSGSGSGGSGSGSGSGGSGGSGSASGGSGSGSGGASATIPVTITLSRGEGTAGLDQAAVSVNFDQQVANNVLSVPVTALLASAGGGYNVQEAASPHTLIPVTVGLFAAGYVQISGPGIYPGLDVTDSQG